MVAPGKTCQVIIDAHTHYGICYEERDGFDISRWFSGLEQTGVEGAVVSTHRGLCGATNTRESNDHLAEIVATRPDKLVAFGTVHPYADPNAVDEVGRCLSALGMKGLKLHPWLQGFPYLDGGRMREICEQCASVGAPIMFHDGTSNVSMPSQVAKLARMFPEATFILGHGGLLHMWREAADAASLHENVYITLCGPHLAALRHICKSVPIERILWGSDYGFGFDNWVPYRRGLVELLDLNADDRLSIMGGNTARLLRWAPR